MRKDELAVGKTYALRIAQTADDNPFAKVTFVGPARSRQARVRYAEGELLGLEEWVPSRLLVCPWGERHAVLRDERRARELDAADEGLWDRITEDAISEVMTASGEYGGFSRRWSSDPASAQRFWGRAGLEGSPLDDHSANFEDRHGQWHLTFSTALKASQAFAAAEPDMVDLYVRGWEERLRAEGFEPGGRHNHDLLREWAPRHALARSWTQRPLGQAAEEEVKRLRSLVRTAAQFLREVGAEDKARRIERGLHGQ